MILIDFSQICLATYFKNQKMLESQDDDLFKHLILNSIRSYVHKYKRKYASNKSSNIAIAVDASNGWRKDVFPHYKAARKKDKDSDDNDWEWIFSVINSLTEEMNSFFPYKVIKIDKAEADDVIGTLTKHAAKNDEPTLIISSDGDFKQLHKHSNVAQYSPMQKKFIEVSNAELELREKIFRGDSGDGIPNFASPDRTFVDGMRQKPIRKKDMEVWLNQPVEVTLDNLDDEYRIGFERNKKLIDLEETPDWLAEQIMECYNREHEGSKNTMLTFFVERNMGELAKSLDEF